MKGIFVILAVFVVFGFFASFGEWVTGFFASYKDMPVGEIVANVTEKLPADMRTEMTIATAEAKEQSAQWHFFQKEWWMTAFTKSGQ